MTWSPPGWRCTTRVVVALATCLVATGFPGTLHAQSVPEAALTGAPLLPRTVAVVPFANISGEPADDWLGSGIAETVAADLHQLGTLSIIGQEAFLDQGLRDEPALTAGNEAGTREAARDLGVSWIVAGGFQRLGRQLRITARIVSVETGSPLHTVKVDGDLEHVFALQDRIVDELRHGFASLVGNPLAVPATATSRPTATPPTAAPQRHPAGSALEEVTGGIAFGDGGPRLGVATGAGVLTGRPTVWPPRTQAPPTIDGQLDDAVWRDAVLITDFVQQQPVDGAPATEETEVYLAYDDTNIYLGFYAHYADPGMIRANRSDRDQAQEDDTLSVYFDTFLDQQRAYIFSVNGYGVQGDSILNSGNRRSGGGRGGGRGGGGGGRGGGGGGGGGRSGGGGGGGGFTSVPRGDSSWDALFESGGQVVGDGFTAEMAIPFKSLRYPQRGANTPHRWGLQISREIRGKDETVVWSPVSRDIAGFLPQMGVLEGMTNLSTSQNLEVMPTFTAVQFGSLDESTGAFVNKDAQPEGGVNVKFGVTSNLVADFTFNPDFSQIESDLPQIEVNQRFALFFPELRPFFLEGAEIFSLTQLAMRVVNTRTIVDPRYGAKLTGKTGNTTLGVMYVNDEAPGDVDDPANPAFGQTAQTLVGRAHYALYAESHIGAIFTDREFLDSHSRLGGIDGDFRLGNTHTFYFRALGTQHRDLDGVDTVGHYLQVFLTRSGRNLSYSAGSYRLSPDYRTDVGFVRRTDEQFGMSNISYRWWPERWLINWGPQFNYSRIHDFDGVLQNENAGTGVNFLFANNIRFSTNVNRDMERFEGIDFFKTRYSLFGDISTSRRISFGVGFNRGDQIFFDPDNPYLGYETAIRSFITVRPFPRFQSEININTSRFTNPRNDGKLAFDVRIFRALTTYQFTDRVLFRNISEYNTFDKALRLNFLFTYRVNAGTVFYVGYDDRYQQADRIGGDVDGDSILNRRFQTTDLFQTNRALFLKIQYLFRK